MEIRSLFHRQLRQLFLDVCGTRGWSGGRSPGCDPRHHPVGGPASSCIRREDQEQRLDEVFANPKFYRTAVWIFAGFALLLAVIGIYAIVAYSVAQRNQEMGVRMALGTTPDRLRGMLLRQGLPMVAAGAISGIIGAQFTGRFLASLMDGAKPIGLATSAGLVLFFALIASVSIGSATRRIAGFDIICHPTQ